MNRIACFTSLLCSIALTLAACGEPPAGAYTMDGSGDTELKRRAARPDASEFAVARAGIGMEMATNSPADDTPEAYGQVYELGIATCLGLGGIGLSTQQVDELRGCCSDADCSFIQEVVVIEGTTCATVSCDCGSGAFDASWDDMAFLECVAAL